MDWLKHVFVLVKGVLPPWAFIVGAVGFFVTITQLYDRYRRSRIIKPVDLGLPEIPDSTIIYAGTPEVEGLILGRRTDVTALRKEIERNQMIFLHGPSGAGKSTLLKLGISRALYSSGRWLPIYLDYWEGDWAVGPLNNLASVVQLAVEHGLTAHQQSTLEIVDRNNVFEVLSRIRAVSARRPLIIFDQMDDYQAPNADKFLDPETHRLITANELQDRNNFWQQLAGLVSRTKDSDNQVHLLFSIRTDAKHGLAPFRFVEAAEYPVDPIRNSDALSLLDYAIPIDAVQHPDNGFQQLKRALARDLSDKELVLPIRLRVAVAGLDAIRDRLTPAAYEKLGGITGLEAIYIERQISDCGKRSDEVRRLLLGFLVSEAGATRTRRDLSRMELVQYLSGDQDSVLAKLEQSRILIKRIVLEEGERWSLYHDYLAFGLIEINRRSRYWELVLERAHTGFLSVQRWSRFAKLLPPGSQIGLWWARARGRVRFGVRRRYVLMSSIRLALNWLTISIAALIGAYLFNDNIRAERSLDAFEAQPGMREFREFWAVTTADTRYQGVIARHLFLSEENKKKSLVSGKVLCEV